MVKHALICRWKNNSGQPLLYVCIAEFSLDLVASGLGIRAAIAKCSNCLEGGRRRGVWRNFFWPSLEKLMEYWEDLSIGAQNTPALIMRYIALLFFTELWILCFLGFKISFGWMVVCLSLQYMPATTAMQGAYLPQYTHVQTATVPVEVGKLYYNQ